MAVVCLAGFETGRYPDNLVVNAGTPEIGLGRRTKQLAEHDSYWRWSLNSSRSAGAQPQVTISGINNSAVWGSFYFDTTTFDFGNGSALPIVEFGSVAIELSGVGVKKPTIAGQYGTFALTVKQSGSAINTISIPTATDNVADQSLNGFTTTQQSEPRTYPFIEGYWIGVQFVIDLNSTTGNNTVIKLTSPTGSVTALCNMNSASATAVDTIILRAGFGKGAKLDDIRIENSGTLGALIPLIRCDLQLPISSLKNDAQYIESPLNQQINITGAGMWHWQGTHQKFYRAGTNGHLLSIDPITLAVTDLFSTDAIPLVANLATMCYHEKLNMMVFLPGYTTGRTWGYITLNDTTKKPSNVYVSGGADHLAIGTVTALPTGLVSSNVSTQIQASCYSPAEEACFFLQDTASGLYISKVYDSGNGVPTIHTWPVLSGVGNFISTALANGTAFNNGSIFGLLYEEASRSLYFATDSAKYVKFQLDVAEDYHVDTNATWGGSLPAEGDVTQAYTIAASITMRSLIRDAGSFTKANEVMALGQGAAVATLDSNTTLDTGFFLGSAVYGCGGYHPFLASVFNLSSTATYFFDPSRAVKRVGTLNVGATATGFNCINPMTGGLICNYATSGLNGLAFCEVRVLENIASDNVGMLQYKNGLSWFHGYSGEGVELETTNIGKTNTLEVIGKNIYLTDCRGKGSLSVTSHSTGNSFITPQLTTTPTNVSFSDYTKDKVADIGIFLDSPLKRENAAYLPAALTIALTGNYLQTANLENFGKESGVDVTASTYLSSNYCAVVNAPYLVANFPTLAASNQESKLIRGTTKIQSFKNLGVVYPPVGGNYINFNSSTITSSANLFSINLVYGLRSTLFNNPIAGTLLESPNIKLTVVQNTAPTAGQCRLQVDILGTTYTFPDSSIISTDFAAISVIRNSANDVIVSIKHVFTGTTFTHTILNSTSSVSWTTVRLMSRSAAISGTDLVSSASGDGWLDGVICGFAIHKNEDYIYPNSFITKYSRPIRLAKV